MKKLILGLGLTAFALNSGTAYSSDRTPLSYGKFACDLQGVEHWDSKSKGHSESSLEEFMFFSKAEILHNEDRLLFVKKSGSQKAFDFPYGKITTIYLDQEVHYSNVIGDDIDSAKIANDGSYLTVEFQSDMYPRLKNYKLAYKCTNS